MWSLIFYLPCTICRTVEAFKNPKHAFAGYCEDLFILTETLLLLSFLPKFLAIALWSFLGPLFLIGWFLPYRFGISLAWNLFSFLRHPLSFLDSARALRPAPVIAAGLFLLAPTYLGFGSAPPLFLLAAVLPALCFASRETENPLFAYIRLKRKKTHGKYTWNFPNEISSYLSPDYPLLRKTSGFKGEKLFSSPLKKPNIVFLSLESFRAKNVGCLGAEIPASPCFDKLAEQGVLFTRFTANGLQTYRSFIASFFSVPPHLETMSLKPYASIPLIGLPSILKENGYKTALMQGGSAAFDWSYPFFQMHGFDTILGKEDFPSGPKTSWGISDETLYAAATNWMERQTESFFLSLFTISNHHPWESPPGWNFPVSSELPSAYRQFLQTFSYSDHALGEFINRTKKENTVFFIFGDHGQGMGEHRKSIELHNDLYQENIHIPLLIFAEGLKPARIDTPAAQVDLLPTVLDLLGLSAVHHSVGKSLLRKENAPVFFSRQNEIGCLSENWKCIAPNQLYQLPDETKNLGPSPALNELARSYFHTAEALYQEKKWAPEKLSFEITAPPQATDSLWLQHLANAPFAPIVNLSNTRLSDQALFAIGKEKASQIHELNLSNTLFSDQALAWIAENCPRLNVLDASYCPLLTENGLRALEQCRHLRHLTLEGDFETLALPPSLAALDLRECHNLKTPLATPHLVYLSASLQSQPKAHLLSLNGLLYAWLSHGTHIDDDALHAFWQNNPSLLILILEDFPLLTKLPPISVQMLKIANCPNLRSIEGVTAAEMSVIGCPGI